MPHNSDNEIDVSIIVPMYYGRKYLPHIFEMVSKNCIFSKGSIKTELILVIDSPDENIGELKKSERFQLTVIMNEKNMGIHRSRLIGLNASRGKYILFLDQDDEITDDAILSLYRVIGENSIAVSDWIEEKICEEKVTQYYISSKKENFNKTYVPRGGNHIGPPGHCLIRKSDIPIEWRNNILRTDGADDYFLWLCMISSDCSLSEYHQPLYTHKYNEKSYSLNYNIMFESEKEAFFLCARLFGYSQRCQNQYLRNLKFRKKRIAVESMNFSKLKVALLYLQYPEKILDRFI